MLFFLRSVGVSIMLVVVWYVNTVGVMRIRHWRTLDQFDGNAGAVSLQHLSDFRRESNINTSLEQILSPALVKLAELGKHDHRWQIASNTVLVWWIPHAVCRASAESLEDDTGDIRSFVSSTQEQRNHRHGNGIGELLGEEKHLEEDFNGDKREEELKPADDFEHYIEPLDLFLVSCEELRGKNISPEDVVFAERDVKIHRVGMMALSREHGHGVVEDVASTLNTLV